MRRDAISEHHSRWADKRPLRRGASGARGADPDRGRPRDSSGARGADPDRGRARGRRHRPFVQTSRPGLKAPIPNMDENRKGTARKRPARRPARGRGRRPDRPRARRVPLPRLAVADPAERRCRADAPLAAAPAPRHAHTVTARPSARPVLAAQPRRPSTPAPTPARPTLADTTSPHVRQPPPASAPAPATTPGVAPAVPAAPPAAKSPEPSASQASASGPACGADGCDPGSGAGSDPGPVTGTIALARRTACQLADCTR